MAVDRSLAGEPGTAGPLVDVDELLAAYRDDVPDPDDPAQRVSFGTSGHRGSALTRSFNDAHVAAMTQAVVEFRREAGTGCGPCDNPIARRHGRLAMFHPYPD